MDPVDRKTNSAVSKSSHLVVKPTLGVTLVIGALRIASGPKTVMIVGRSLNFPHIAGVELTVKENVGLSGLVEVESVALWK